MIPPPVEPAHPPINIKSRDTTEDAFVRFSWGSVANPAVLVVTDWNRETWILSNRDIFPMVRGL